MIDRERFHGQPWDPCLALYDVLSFGHLIYFRAHKPLHYTLIDGPSMGKGLTLAFTYGLVQSTV